MTDVTRIRLTVAYDGTDFSGWAAQAERRTVQGTLTEALRQITGEEIEVIGASRTDAGAHALGQVAHFDFHSGPPVKKWPGVLNRALPDDLRVVEAMQVDGEFHARFCADKRTYRYRLLEIARDPFELRTGYAVSEQLDYSRMREAAALLVGVHDFRGFSAELEPTIENTVRQLHAIDLIEFQGGVDVIIVGNAFLRGMMRRIVGFLTEVGRSRRPIEHGPGLLSPVQRSQFQLPVVLPAKGLCLIRVDYLDPPVDCRIQLLPNASD